MVRQWYKYVFYNNIKCYISDFQFCYVINNLFTLSLDCFIRKIRLNHSLIFEWSDCIVTMRSFQFIYSLRWGAKITSLFIVCRRAAFSFLYTIRGPTHSEKQQFFSSSLSLSLSLHFFSFILHFHIPHPLHFIFW